MSVQRRTVLAATAASLLPAVRPANASTLLSPRAREPWVRPTVIIGQSAVRSGISQRLGDEMAQGLQAAFTEANRAGVDRQFVLESLDDGYEPDRCRTNTASLIDRGVFALAGFVGTPTCLAAMPIVDQAGVPFVGPFTGAPALREHRPGVFHIRASYLEEARTIVKQLLAFGQAARIAIFRQDDAYGLSVENATRAAMAELIEDPKAREPVVIAKVPRNSLDVAAAAKAIAASGATGVVVASVAGATSKLIEQLGAIARGMMFVSVSFIGTSALLKGLGPKAGGIGICQVMPSPWYGSTSFVAGYQKAMQTTFGNGCELSYGSIEGYACGRTIVEGVRRCGSNLSRQAFVNALESRIDLGGFVLAFSGASHAPGSYTDLTVVDGLGKLRK